MIRIKRCDRLIASAVIGTLLIVWLVLVGFDALTQLIRQLGDVGQHGYTITDAIIYIALTLPRRMYEYFGNAALIGGLLGLGGLAASGELTALRAAGMSKLRIAASVVLIVGALTVLVVLMGETVAPVGDQQAQALQVRSRSHSLGLSSGGGLWARDGNHVINARNAIAVRHEGMPSVQLSDVRQFTLDKGGQLTRFMHAHDASHQGQHWILHQVRISDLTGHGVVAREVASLPWQTNLNPRVLEQSVVHPEYLSMRDLLRNMHYSRANGINAGVYSNAFWAHALYPLNVLALVLCAMPFAFGALRSGGLGKRLFVGILLAIGWYFLQRVITNTGTVYGLSPLLANLLPALGLLAVAGVYFRRHG